MFKALKKVANKMAPKRAGATGHGDGWHLDDYNTDELIGKIYMFFEAQVLARRKPSAHRVPVYLLELPLHSSSFTSRG
jgi:hypothetical protein